MAKFIEIHKDGEALLINLDNICGIMRTGDHGEIHFIYPAGGYTVGDETYDQLREMIASAHGGIPMNTWRDDDGK